jgi:hypothetical protein
MLLKKACSFHLDGWHSETTETQKSRHAITEERKELSRKESRLGREGETREHWRAHSKAKPFAKILYTAYVP